MASQMEPKTQTAKDILKNLYPQVDASGRGRLPGFLWEEYDKLREKLVQVEFEERVRAFEELADRLQKLVDEGEGHMMSAYHIIGSIRKTARQIRQEGLVPIKDGIDHDAPDPGFLEQPPATSGPGTGME